MSYKVNELYFNNIDTHNKAYILGFLAADDYLCTPANRIHLEIHNKDSALLDFIKKELNSDHKIYTPRENTVKLSIQRKQICEDLKKLGFTNRKSYQFQFPNINRKYYNSFILGVFDGDGTVILENYAKSAKRLSISILGSTELLTKIKEILSEIQIISAIGNTKSLLTKTLRFSSKNSIKTFYEYIYKNSEFYLERKHNHFYNFFKN